MGILNQVAGAVTTQVGSYFGGVVRGQVQRAIDKLTLKVPTQLRGIIGYAFQDNDIEVLPTIMYQIEIGDVTFSDAYFKRVVLPTVQFEYESQRQDGKKIQYIKDFNLGELTIECYESRAAEVLTYAHQKKNSMFDPSTGVYAYPAQYKQNIKVTIIEHDNSEVVAFNYIGCSFKNISGYSMGNEPSGFVQPTLTWTVDDMQLSIRGQMIDGGRSGLSSFLSGVISGVVSMARNTVNTFIGF